MTISSNVTELRLIRRGKLGISVWVRVILDKYLYSRPSHRTAAGHWQAKEIVGISPGTIAGGLRQLLPLLEHSVREAIRSRQLSEDRWHGRRDRLDESFVEVEGKAGQG